jgi:hypothetical protein
MALSSARSSFFFNRFKQKLDLRHTPKKRVRRIHSGRAESGTV